MTHKGQLCSQMLFIFHIKNKETKTTQLGGQPSHMPLWGQLEGKGLFTSAGTHGTKSRGTARSELCLAWHTGYSQLHHLPLPLPLTLYLVPSDPFSYFDLSAHQEGIPWP